MALGKLPVPLGFEAEMWNLFVLIPDHCAFLFLAYRIRISACFTWTDNSYLTLVVSPRAG